jgi:hypothetical protein
VSIVVVLAEDRQIPLAGTDSFALADPVVLQGNDRDPPTST